MEALSAGASKAITAWATQAPRVRAAGGGCALVLAAAPSAGPGARVAPALHPLLPYLGLLLFQ